jgi:very-short-patch-repair endonuclease
MGARWLTEAQVEAYQRKRALRFAPAPPAAHVVALIRGKSAQASPATRSELEAELQRQIEAVALVARYDAPYLIGSRFRADVLFEAGRLVVEVQGGVHRIKAKAHADIRKAAESLLQGWRLLPVDKDAIYSGDALKWITQLLGVRA